MARDAFAAAYAAALADSRPLRRLARAYGIPATGAALRAFVASLEG